MADYSWGDIRHSPNRKRQTCGVSVQRLGSGKNQRHCGYKQAGSLRMIKTAVPRPVALTEIPDSADYSGHELACDLQVNPGSGYAAALNPLPVFL